MKDLWKQYSGDFNSMTDQEIDAETEISQNYIDEHTEWVEAVASWKAAGKPRDEDTTND